MEEKAWELHVLIDFFSSWPNVISEHLSFQIISIKSSKS